MPGRHLSILRPLTTAQPESRALDECPFPRPFARDFDRCPTYQPSLAPVENSRGAPVGTVWTCEHLSATRLHNQARYYGRCGLGDALGRSRWLAAAADHRLLEIRGLRIDFHRAAEAELSELIAARAALKSRASRADDARMETASRAILVALDAFAQARSTAFSTAGVGPVLLHRCLEATLSLATYRSELEALRPPADLIRDYPLPVQAFLRPDLVSA